MIQASGKPWWGTFFQGSSLEVIFVAELPAGFPFFLGYWLKIESKTKTV